MEQQLRQETRVVVKIAPPETAGLDGQSEKPFEAERLYPSGRLPHFAGMKIESGAYADQDRGLEQATMCRHPALLFGSAETDPHDIGIRFIDPRGNLEAFLVAERTERRRVAAGDFEAGILQRKALG